MPEVLGNPPSPRVALFWNGTGWQWALVDAAGHLQIDTVTSALPAGAATAANQVIINTTIGLVALIRNALQSVDTDRLIVRGEDQLHSFHSVLAFRTEDTLTIAGGAADSAACPDGFIWHVTAVAATNRTTATTAHRYVQVHDGQAPAFLHEIKAFAKDDHSYWHGDLWLDHNDYIAVYFIGGLVGDTCRISVLGEVFTKET